MSAHQIVAYNYDRPRRSDVLTALERVATPTQARMAWDRACARADVAANDDDLPLAGLLRVTDALREEGGLIKIAAVALAVRIRTFTSLERNTQGATR